MSWFGVHVHRTEQLISMKFYSNKSNEKKSSHTLNIFALNVKSIDLKFCYTGNVIKKSSSNLATTYFRKFDPIESKPLGETEGYVNKNIDRRYDKVVYVTIVYSWNMS